MPKYEPNYFGVALGEAFANAGKSIGDAYSRRRELERTRAEKLEDEQRSMEQASQMMAMKQGYEYSPAGFEQFLADQKRIREMNMAEKQAGIETEKARAGYYGAQSGKAESTAFSPAQKAVDVAFGKDYAEYVAGGGSAKIAKNLKELGDVKAMLESGKQNLTGPILGLAPQGIKSMINPEAVRTQQRVENIVQETLRQTLGAQFTENEGKLFMQRGYNPMLPESENAKTLATRMEELKSMARAKEEAIRYYEDNGTMKGFKGRMFTLAEGNPKPISAEQADKMGMFEEAPAAPVEQSAGWNESKERRYQELKARLGR